MAGKLAAASTRTVDKANVLADVLFVLISGWKWAFLARGASQSEELLLDLVFFGAAATAALNVQHMFFLIICCTYQ
jgi:hypothetical protein